MDGRVMRAKPANSEFGIRNSEKAQPKPANSDFGLRNSEKAQPKYQEKKNLHID